jgi:hypothetical protein
MARKKKLPPALRENANKVKQGERPGKKKTSKKTTRRQK